MARDKDPLTVTRREISELPETLRNSALASVALHLAKKLQAAGIRDTAPIARELRTVLDQLHEASNRVPEEADPVQNAQGANANRFADSDV